MTATDQVLVFDIDPARASTILALLERADSSRAVESFRAFSDLKAQGYGHSPGVQAIHGGQAALIVVVEAEAFASLAELAREDGVPTLLVVDPSGEAHRLADRVRGYDGWVMGDAVDRELPIRVAGLIEGRRKDSAQLPSIDPRFLALVIHDLRTPLNVIGLTIRAISQTVPQRTAELDEDLSFLTDNARQIEKMLAQLGDFCRLIEGEPQVLGVEFDARRFLSDFLEDRRGRPGSEPTPVRLEWAESAPIEVKLDPQRVRLALQHALANAISAAGESPVRLRSRGEPGRWLVEFVVDKPPPPTIGPMELRPDRFERLAGSAAERRGARPGDRGPGLGDVRGDGPAGGRAQSPDDHRPRLARPARRRSLIDLDGSRGSRHGACLAPEMAKARREIPSSTPSIDPLRIEIRGPSWLPPRSINRDWILAEFSKGDRGRAFPRSSRPGRRPPRRPTPRSASSTTRSPRPTDATA